ncbi:multiubiquitin domain-containing protein [Mycoplasmatota bacterium]|nr:multiubiquitin domain-containing protein [Mycoplasmatota bacterium]
MENKEKRVNVYIDGEKPIEVEKRKYTYKEIVQLAGYKVDDSNPKMYRVTYSSKEDKKLKDLIKGQEIMMKERLRISVIPSDKS